MRIELWLKSYPSKNPALPQVGHMYISISAIYKKISLSDPGSTNSISYILMQPVAQWLVHL